MKLALSKISPSPIAHGCRGILLVECVVYLAVLSLVTGLSLGAYFRCETTSRQLRQNASDVGQVLEAGERWREDIRAASGLLEMVTEENELRIPRENGAITYQFREGALARQSPTVPRQIILKNLRSSRMFADQRGSVTTWRWEIELRSEKKEPKLRPLFSFQAVPMRGQNSLPK